ncbi:MAG: response regulator [Rhodoferax sp.]|nr:response regulator [Rhodoferax sp.]
MLSVNKHYLEKVMDLAEEQDVNTTEDIFDSRGVKLIAKGTRISRGLQERLILHKLQKPLESCIALEGGIEINAIVAEARRLSETSEAMGYILKATQGGGFSPLDTLAKIQFGNAMGMMLTIINRGGAADLTHSVMVSLLSTCLANKLGLSEKDQSNVALGGLLHDIGELYIEPAYLHSPKRLLPQEWRHVVVHPRISQMLIEELENYPAAIALAVSEHHERFDGTGYPRLLAGKSISVAGQILSVAEMVSGVLLQADNPLERAELALRIIPREHGSALVSAVSSTLRSSHHQPSVQSSMTSDDANERAKILFDHIAVVVETGNKMDALPTIRSNKAKELRAQALQRIDTIQRAFFSTGLDACERDDTAKNREILFESIAATKEIQWRLRDVARHLALHSAAFDPAEAQAFAPIIAMLDAEPDLQSLVQKYSDQEAPSQPSDAPPKPARTLLLVDDEPHVLSAIARGLRPQGYHILTAPDGDSALELLANHAVGVILADHRMPGMTGVELLSKVKASYPLTVRMVLSGHADLETVTDAIRLGAIYKYQTKPWDEAELCAAVENAFDKYEGDRLLAKSAMAA